MLSKGSLISSNMISLMYLHCYVADSCIAAIPHGEYNLGRTELGSLPSL